MSNHTPGPWEVLPDNHRVDGCQCFEIYSPHSDKWVALVQDGHDGLGNMNLIAAAPELYEGLKLFLEFYEGDKIDDFDKRLRDARAALAKAEGK